MIYSQGDIVVHQSFGVGRVLNIETKNTGSGKRLYYRMSFDKTTVWVPVRENEGGGVRPITPKSDLRRYRKLLKSSPEPLEGDFRERQVELEKRMEAGTYESLCAVVRDLSGRLSRTSLTHYEKTLLKQTHAALISEWSQASGVSPDQACDEIEACLRVGRQILAEV
jgi:RNA polymerase-interacting CarD/CdnL/TRCF family regulator